MTLTRGAARGSARNAAGTCDGRFAEGRRARGAKLIGAAVAPQRADGRNPMPARGQDVMLAIAPHAAIVGLEPLALENVSDQVRLVLKAPAELVAVGRLEVTLKVEVGEDPLGVDEGLRRAKEEARSRGAQFASASFTPVIDDSLEKTFGRIAAAIDLERLLGIALAVQRLGETSAQRRPDDPGEFRGRRRASSQRLERKAKAADDALGRVGQRSVQIDQERASPIGLRRRRSSIARCSGRLPPRRRPGSAISDGKLASSARPASRGSARARPPRAGNRRARSAR